MSLRVKRADVVDHAGAKAVIDGLAAPAPRASIIEWLTICAVKTVSARDDDMASDLNMKVFADDLGQYPGDIVHHVLKEWPERNKWFPSWSELRDEIDRLSGLRPEIIRRVRSRLIDGGQAA